MKNFRIIEKTYGDGHKTYKAQKVFLNFGLFKIWEDYICDVLDMGYGRIRYICCGETYEDCRQHLLETIEKKEKQRLKNTIINKTSYKV